MKKMTIMAFAIATFALTACNNSNKSEQKATVPVEETAITDEAFQKAAAGDYKSFDGTKVITLTSDFNVTTKKDKAYYKWELQMQPQDSVAAITLNSKGQDTDIKTPAQLDLTEGTLVVKNETYRKTK